MKIFTLALTIVLLVDVNATTSIDEHPQLRGGNDGGIGTVDSDSEVTKGFRRFLKPKKDKADKQDKKKNDKKKQDKGGSSTILSGGSSCTSLFPGGKGTTCATEKSCKKEGANLSKVFGQAGCPSGTVCCGIDYKPTSPPR